MANFSTTPYQMVRRTRKPALSQKEKQERMRQVIFAAQEAKRIKEEQAAREPKLKSVVTIKPEDDLEGMPVVERKPKVEAKAEPAPEKKPQPAILPKSKHRQILMNRHAKKTS